jgi:hypothetical protein
LPKLEIKSQLTIAVDSSEADLDVPPGGVLQINLVDMIEVSSFQHPNDTNFFRQF